MRDVVDMWRNTRMVVLTAMTASLYAAILIPFKVLPIIPGVTEFRPANAVPVICSFLFGPAAAWGSAIGNVIGDFFGGIGPGDFFGFFGNFFYGLIPYKLWELIASEDPAPPLHGRWREFLLDLVWLKYLAVVFFAAAACAVVIGWGLNMLGFIPFSVLGNIVLINNMAVATTLGPILLAVLYPRVKRARLLYRDVMPERVPTPRWRATLGFICIAVATIGAIAVGNLVSTGQLSFPQLDAVIGDHSTAVAAGLESQWRMRQTTLALSPLLALLVVGVMLL